MGKEPGVIFIFGPTAVGKTAFVEELATRIPAEIVNMDVGQFYVPLAVGTAKPDWRAAAIPHHLFDILEQPRNFTVVEYRKRLQETIASIHERRHIPLIVGGSAFYLTSLLFPPKEVPQVLQYNHVDDEQLSLWQRLHAIDPQRSACIAPTDHYRLKRALAIWHAAGIQPSLYKPHFAPLCPFIILCITRDRQELYHRIDERVIKMMHDGWLDEVLALQGGEWDTFLRQKKLIGYPELLAYLEDQTPELHTVISDIQQKTRHYAKRQLTFWRRLERLLASVTQDRDAIRGIYELNLTHSDCDIYIEQLLSLVRELK